MTDGLASRRYGHPVIVALGKAVIHLRSRQVPLVSDPGNKPDFDESWMQALVYEHPEVLPVGELEPAFDNPIPLAREVPVGNGFADALFVNAAGYVTLVEVKLFRNQEARSDVVAQTIDYLRKSPSGTFLPLPVRSAPARIPDYPTLLVRACTNTLHTKYGNDTTRNPCRSGIGWTACSKTLRMVACSC